MVGSKSKVKSFEIDKRLVHEAWMKVQANGGAPGVDAVSIGGVFGGGGGKPLKLWDPMSSRRQLSGPGRGGGVSQEHWGGGKGVGGPQLGGRKTPKKGGRGVG